MPYDILPDSSTISEPTLDSKGRPTTLFGIPVVYSDDVPPPAKIRLGGFREYIVPIRKAREQDC